MALTATQVQWIDAFCREQLASSAAVSAFVQLPRASQLAQLNTWLNAQKAALQARNTATEKTAADAAITTSVSDITAVTTGLT